VSLQHRRQYSYDKESDYKIQLWNMGQRVVPEDMVKCLRWLSNGAVNIAAKA
jgi:hypothetical protein